MPAPPAKPRPRRLVLPPLTAVQQALFTFDDDFPKAQMKPAAEKVLGARRSEKKTTVVVPDGMHVHVRDGADREWHPLEPLRGRGQPPKMPAGTWDDDDLFDTVKDILGDPDEREDRGPEILGAVCRVAREFLGAERFTKEREDIVQSLARKAITKRVASDEIVRQLRVWRHDLTDPAVRDMQKRLRQPVAQDFTALVLKYQSYQPFLDADGKPATYEDGRPILVPAGPPVCDEEGRLIMWVPDEHGQPSRPYIPGEPRPRRLVKTVRPRVKMIFL